LVKDKSTRLNLGDPGGRKLSRNAAKYIRHFVQIIDSLTHTHIQPKGGNKRSDWADDKDNKKTSFVVGCCFFCLERSPEAFVNIYSIHFLIYCVALVRSLPMSAQAPSYLLDPVLSIDFITFRADGRD
jgi:hypothetical protein